MTAKKATPAVQSAQSDEGLYVQWRSLCRKRGVVPESEDALRALPVELARECLTVAISRLSGVAR